ncbi:hypothetical protein ABB37_01400 [Leptomonas pyrrhocoris]|uniref:Uncharacterized protein n=1 Tax=Leptomonas pyrrhocoris TaxID=157538 RepID=A0A0N0VH95_LEPPY|nr:hypothetical protein ABB37_01400 [Leptomonas pyrrhocoris]KPA84961.1 hypothetical protein ABB37_01400 [Leptomonas pyrrhocoris]|eukprot:XP_015663400.1 hypothetical protein ABB37_01400 [Leptomonas pyrrhocoris]
MPPIELHSLESFSGWLHDNFVDAVPFGLSLRLRPLSTSSSAAPSRSTVLVRPHVGHVLLSLLARDSPELLTDGAKDSGAASSCFEDATPGREALSGHATSVNTNSPLFNSGPHFYPLLMQILLQLTRSDDEGRPVSSSTSSFSPTSELGAAAAVDGVGRKLNLFAVLLRHCAQWWMPKDEADRSSSASSRLHHLRGTAPRPFLFFESSAVAVPSPVECTSQLPNAQRLLLRVLRRLSQCGGWHLRLAPPKSGATNEGEDWLDYVVQQAVDCDLRPYGDYRSILHSGSFTASSSCSASTSGNNGNTNSVLGEPSPSEPVVSVETMRAVLWHILATEVEGDVLAVLHRLAVEFLCGATAMGGEAATLNATRAKVVPLSCVRFALRRLLRTPERAFTCCPTTSSALLPPVSGPIAFSRVLPRAICILPFADEHAGPAGGDATSPTRTSRFFLHGVRTTTADGAAHRAVRRVLLLRVDPEGCWLPAAEELASQRSFHASFQSQGERDGPRATALPSEDRGGVCEEADSDDFALREAQSSGRRDVNNVDVAQAKDAAPRSSTQSGIESSAAEDATISFLTSHVLRQTPFVQSMASASAKDQLMWGATVRLYLYALLHEVRVILTPERLPALTKVFGYRHLSQLHQALCDLRKKRGRETAPSGAYNTLDTAVTTLLAAACAHEPPVAIYAVDQLDLQAFTQLQGEAGQHTQDGNERSRRSLLPVVLCRDVLRSLSSQSLAPSAAATPSLVSGQGSRSASLPQGVFAVTHCCVLDEEVVCRAWARHPSVGDADALMEACAGAERLFLPRKRDLCLLAFTPLSEAAFTNANSTLSNDAQELELRCPSILLVAPTHVHATYYVGLLRKAGLALSDALPDLPTRSGDRSARQETSGLPGESLRGVVRGGGGFYIAVAKQLRLLLLRLQGASLTASSISRSHVVGFGDDVPLRERRWVCYVLYLLAEACGAVATQHAEPVIAGEGERQNEANTASRAWTCGPRTRRRLWLEVLRGTVESCAPSSFATSAAKPSTLPALHVRHAGMTSSFAGPRCLPTSSRGGKSEEEKPSTPYEVAMRLFVSQPPSQRYDDEGEVAKGEELPLFEPLRANLRAVREALSLLVFTLSATV